MITIRDHGQRWLHHQNSLAWFRTIPELTAYVESVRRGSRTAFVLAPGPSLACVTAGGFEYLKRFFTVGVNKTARWLQENRREFDLPSLNLWGDPINPSGPEFETNSDALACCRGRTLVDEDAHHLHHDWVCTVFGGNLSWDLFEGLTLCPGRDFLHWRRTAVAAVHLCALLGFRLIVLLGADHGEDYHPGEPARANEGYRRLDVWLAVRGVELVNAGRRSSVTSIRTVQVPELYAETVVEPRKVVAW